MPKEPTNNKRFLTFVQKKLKLTKKEIAESEQWIDGFKTAVKATEKIKMFPEWQPIETAPKDGTNILVVCGDYREMTVAYYINSKNKLKRGWFSGYVPLHPTQWIPLPEFPTK